MLGGGRLLQADLLRGHRHGVRGPAVDGAGRQLVQVFLPRRAGGRLGGLPRGPQVLQCRPHPPGARPRIPPPGRQRLPAQQVRPGRRGLAGFLSPGGGPGGSQDLPGQLRQSRLGPVGLRRGVRGDLDPVAGHHGQPPQPGRRAGPKTVKNRVHLDLTSSAADRDQEIDRLVSLGARRVDIGQTGKESWTVLADPEGNEFCVVRPKETLIR